MKKSFLPFATVVLAAFTLASCGPAQQNEEPIRPVKAFSYGETSKNAANFDLFIAHRVNLYANNVYEYTQTQITYGYQMNLGTSVVTTYGTYTTGTTEDGVTPYTLNEASEVVLSSYSNAGGFKIQINTASEAQTYPAEMPAAAQGEKPMANSKEDVIDAYGVGTILYVGNDNVISFIDPNSEEDNPSKAEITTPSGSVSSVVKEFKQVQVVGNIVSGTMTHYVVDYLHTFSDDTYEYGQTDITYGYNMVLGTKTVTNFGKGTYGVSEDGVTPYTLNDADDVVLNSYSKAGGFSIAVNTASEAQTYPTELPAAAEGEKPMANSKEDVITAYGKGFVAYTSDENCVMSLTDPNA